MDVAAFDGSDRLDATQGCLGGSQGPKALTIPEQALHSGVIALDQVVSPLPVNVPDTVKVRIIAMIDFPYNPPIGLGFVSADRDWPMQSDPLDSFVEEGFGILRVPSGGQPEIDHLTVGIHRTPEVAPFAADADVGFIHVPINAGPAQMQFCALCKVRARLLDPAINRRSINSHTALGQQIGDILVGQRIAQVPARRATRKGSCLVGSDGA